MVTGEFRTETTYGLTSLGVEKAGPARLLALQRGHWSIENRLHWIRDWAFDEDRCRIRRGRGARVMASLRNLAISLLRFCGRHRLRPLRLIGLAMA